MYICIYRFIYLFIYLSIYPKPTATTAAWLGFLDFWIPFLLKKESIWRQCFLNQSKFWTPRHHEELQKPSQDSLQNIQKTIPHTLPRLPNTFFKTPRAPKMPQDPQDHEAQFYDE